MNPPVAEWIGLARIRRPQGRKGEVIADLLTDFPEKFSERRRLWLLSQTAAPREVELAAHWLHKGGIVLHFTGIDSISGAESLAGLTVAIPREQRAALGEGEVYISDLVGCALIQAAGTEPLKIGIIEDVDRTAGPVPLLIVRGDAGQILVPFAKSYLRKLDLDQKRVEMDLPEGLIELNN